MKRQILGVITRQRNQARETQDLIRRSGRKKMLFPDTDNDILLDVGNDKARSLLGVNREPMSKLSVLASKPFELIRYSPQDLAKQLTIVDAKLFSKVSPDEFFDCNWTRAETNQQRSPNILLLTDRFNNISLWLQNVILRVKTSRKRAHMVCYFIATAVELKKLHNYASMMALTTSLGGVAVSRLKKTWQLVPESMVKDYAMLQEICFPIAGFRNYRALLSQTDGAVIPFIAIWMTDVTFLNEMHTTVSRKEALENEARNRPPVSWTTEKRDDRLINFSKMSSLGEIMLSLKQYKSKLNEFKYMQPIPDFVQYFDDTKGTIGSFTQGLMSETELYTVSKVLEPSRDSASLSKKHVPALLFGSLRRHSREVSRSSLITPDSTSDYTSGRSTASSQFDTDDLLDSNEISGGLSRAKRKASRSSGDLASLRHAFKRWQSLSVDGELICKNPIYGKDEQIEALNQSPASALHSVKNAKTYERRRVRNRVFYSFRNFYLFSYSDTNKAVSYTHLTLPTNREV
eukprot:TRINITY_DN1408_c0_g1_i2.p1 TRINITY_DN1408_c0_g1~~TRINITY_DN1408_c0_g1_i2.p1  ORF type:complete len:517 (-),score=69.34 TRINITY_DN1408_c0_g1_i2:17-1567(-)